MSFVIYGRCGTLFNYSSHRVSVWDSVQLGYHLPTVLTLDHMLFQKAELKQLLLFS